MGSRPGRQGTLLVAAIVVAAGSAVGCRSAPEAADLAAVAAAVPRPAPKVVLIGLDGADWTVARPLIAEGRLPVLDGLIRAGASGDLRSLEPMISPALWTTVVTGVRPERHGVRDFVYRRPGSYAQPIVNSAIRERLALWNILSGLGLEVGVVDWYATWPAERVNGFIVSDRIKTLGPEAEGVTYPDHDKLAEALSAAPPVEGLPALERLMRVAVPMPEELDKALKEDLYRYGIAKNLYRSRRPGFFAFYLKGLDAVGHFYWKYFDPDPEIFGEVDAREVARLGTIIPAYYELCDQLLGDFLESVDEETSVVVVSDHGFGPFGRPDSLIFDLDRLFARMGLLEFEDPALAGRRSEREIRMDATRAWAHPGAKIVSALGRRERPVYLNVAGRDPQGVIDAASWLDARTEIKTRLESLRTGLGSRVFSRVRVHEGPGRPDRQEPDLYLRVNPEIAFDHHVLIDNRPFSLFDEFFWEYGNISGTHRLDGILVARGPMIGKGVTVRGARLLDIAPTILRLVGAPVPDDLDGRVLRGIFAGRPEPSRVRVASYEGLVPKEDAAPESVPLDEAYRDRLRALGYLE